jgi:hypothetical protein
LQQGGGLWGIFTVGLAQYSGLFHLNS